MARIAVDVPGPICADFVRVDPPSLYYCAAVTTIAPTADHAPVPSSNMQSFDRAARIIFGAMVALIVLLTALLLETSAGTAPATADDGVALAAPVTAQSAAAH
jgi:hypothetical protein